MPRPIPDVTILIREKNKTKSHKIEVFNHKENFVKLKNNGEWYKKKLAFNRKKLGNLILDLVEEFIDEH